MDVIEFEHTPSRIFEVLQAFKPRIMKADCLAVLKLAFAHGAYVAGGFARKVLKHGEQRLLDRDEGAYDDICQYLRIDEKIDESKPYWKVGRGDIDLFFSDRQELGRFTDALGKLSRVKVTELPSGAGLELVCDDTCCIQVITRYVAPIAQMLASFDIYNAMVAFNDKETIVGKDWYSLEEMRLVHVVNWTSPYVINRVSKWLRRHRMKGVTPKTASEMGDKALTIINELREKGPIKMPWGSYDEAKVIAVLKPMLPMLTNDQLLLLTAHYPCEAYNTPMDILFKRAKL